VPDFSQTPREVGHFGELREERGTSRIAGASKIKSLGLRALKIRLEKEEWGTPY